MQTLGSISALVAAIRDEAEQAEEAVQKKLAAELERFVAEDPVLETDAPDRAARLSHARRRAREARSRQDWLDRRAALEERERWMAAVMAEALRRLNDPSDQAARLETLRRQVDEARQRLPGEAFEVVVPEADATLLENELGESFRITADPSMPEGGCLVRTADGKVGYDNGLETRARRRESAWRAALGELYER